ncbi:energy transducer TonB [Nisaea nitritireducens]|uniref:energy transducer TonB n=1 Tax=Nisaea nitritireducens TaxID=568392 RepID=UPI0018690911|nr:energy transducer TonB [Nisaea nitritireducens]
MSAIVEQRGTSPSMFAGFAVALALHGLALLSFVAFEQPATSSADTGEGGLVVMMGDAGGVTAQTVAENIQAAEASGVPDGESVEEVIEQTVAVPVPETPVTEVTEATPVPVVPVETVVEPVETAEAEPVEAEQVETTEAVPVPQETVVTEAAEIVPVETVTAAVQPPPLPVTRPAPPRPVEQVKPVETEVVEAKPVDVAPKQPKATDAVLADKVQKAQKKKGSGTFDIASSAPNRAAGPGQTQASSGGGGAAGARKSYFASIQSWLERHKKYPRAARLRRYEGTVAFSFQINRSGSIMKRSIVKSSGRKILDEALLDLLKRADPMPPMPPEISGATFDFTTSIEYNLR